MKILHLNAGNETGGGMYHILMLLNELPREEVVLGVFEEGELRRRAAELGIQTIVFKQEKRRDFSIVKRISHYIQEEKIDMIHTHGPRANLFGVFIKKKAKCQWLLTVHSDPSDDFIGKGLKGKVFTYINQWAIKKADHLFAISDRFFHMLTAYKIAPQKMTTIYNGLDFKQTAAKRLRRESIGLTAEDFVIIMVARLEKVKNHPLAIEAVARICSEKPEVKLLIIGDGHEKNAIADLIETHQLHNHVFMLGQREDVGDIYPLADVALLTSKSESFPLVLLEAAREKIPAITTDVGGVERMIPSQAYGWVVKTSRASAISEAIESAYQAREDDAIHTMGNRFYEHCREHFSIENQAKDIYAVYQKMLANS